MGNIFNLSDQISYPGVIPPQLVDNAAVTSTWVSMSDNALVAFELLLGATDITVDAKLQSAEDSSGTNAADITGKVITQLSATDDNKERILEARAEDLANTGHTHVAMVVTVGDGTLGANVAVSAVGQPGHGLPPTNKSTVLVE